MNPLLLFAPLLGTFFLARLLCCYVAALAEDLRDHDRM